MLRFLRYYIIIIIPLLLFVGTVIGAYYSTKLPWPLMLISIVLMLAFDAGVAFCAIDGFFKDDIAEQKLKKKNGWKDVK